MCWAGVGGDLNPGVQWGFNIKRDTAFIGLFCWAGSPVFIGCIGHWMGIDYIEKI